ncbi:MAG: hypothetical protein JWN30_1337 [Bacilli bacterium]|nr:hypothetical protein [Bacilli bacterium]
MKAEIEKVLTMVKEGKIDVEKASELIHLIDKKQSNYLDKTLKIKIISAENDNITVNLPIKLLKVVLLAGHSIASGIPDAEKYVKDIDINLLLEAIENELDGQIVDVKSANGDLVSVVIG